MINKTLTAGIICFALFVSAFFLSGQSSIYFNATAFLVVVSGTIGAGLMSFGPARFRQAFTFAAISYQEKPHRQKKLVDTLLSLGHLHRRHGVISPASVEQMFPAAARGLELLKDGYSESEIKDIMTSEARSHYLSRQELERVFRSMAAYAPSFGVAGSVIGLVGLLMGMEETSLILKSIPITLVSTLYGITLANFLFFPVAEKIRQETDLETREREIILCAMVAMTRKADFLKLQRMLNAMVSDPDSRVEDSGAFRRISIQLKAENA